MCIYLMFVLLLFAQLAVLARQGLYIIYIFDSHVITMITCHFSYPRLLNCLSCRPIPLLLYICHFVRLFCILYFLFLF